jgi:hypothetical protein
MTSLIDTAAPAECTTAIGGGEQHSILGAVDELDQLGCAIGRDILVDAHRNRLLADYADGRERLLRQRGRGLGRDQSAGARAVDHHDLLLPKLCQLVGDDTGHHVRTVAGVGRCDELHRLR